MSAEVRRGECVCTEDVLQPGVMCRDPATAEDLRCDYCRAHCGTEAARKAAAWGWQISEGATQ